MNDGVLKRVLNIIHGSLSQISTATLDLQIIAMDQFAMVEELAFLIKDNLPCKHLILSMEDILVEFLQRNTCFEAVLELVPMNPYHRMLLHRLAEIFGLAHESVGEGEDRHLILERCENSLIPAILVSDILWQHDEYQSPKAVQQLLRRTEISPSTMTSQCSSKPPTQSLKEKEAAYLAARERIFSLKEDDVEPKELVPPKPRNVPVVARRMIAHALGQRMNPASPQEKPALPNAAQRQNKDFSEREKYGVCSHDCSSQFPSIIETKKNSSRILSGSGPLNLTSENNSKGGGMDILEQTQLRAAKRLFAQALGKKERIISRTKAQQGERVN
ncbi:uncharacterized protein LOC18440072 isoform X1 [Amborella trichopoda]|uniref:uncharacterized protein LOC18440072 isoform X1 n=1 Tax=Amborella trichopoda TaxID=13333 RepID=UPI0005D38539|nr:uncharacterized protein LOC18440072 isoform X1 [Amborella trichopoda]|eukprot:XP_011625542.1 uncharacterized protein LOC18440072 isoform X1 [Amborella trichopoda]